MASKTGVLIVNLGTPNSPSTQDVRVYLREFLMDGRVVDIPFFARWMLVNLIIAPFRAPKSAKAYQKVWTSEGSPLMVYGKRLEQALQSALGKDYDVVLAMRYQQPSIKEGIQKLRSKGYTQWIVLPLFPQYASATTGSVMEEVMREVSKLQIIPEIRLISNYFDHPLMINAFAAIAKKYLDKEQYDHILFSYHGLPERQIRKGDSSQQCLKEGVDCCASIHAGNYYCYRAQCYATTRLIAEQLGLSKEQYTVMFQSRLGKNPWIRPYADDVIEEMAKQGKKKILCMVPSFVADCLETIEEVGEEYKEAFLHAGGTHWQFVESLNVHPIWVSCVKDLIERPV